MTANGALEGHAPRDEKGRFMSRTCPACGEGRLHLEVTRWGRQWYCDALIDPNNNEQELQACTYTHVDGLNR